MLSTLTSSGLDAETLVVFHSDHGFGLGEHASWHKQTNFELATRVPLIIKVPWLQSTCGGQTTKVFAELLDIFPTLADLTGTTLHDQLDGKSLAHLFISPHQALTDDDAAFSQ